MRAIKDADAHKNEILDVAEIAADRDVPALRRLTRMMPALNAEGSLGHEIMEERNGTNH